MPLLLNDIVYFTTDSNLIFALNAGDGTQVWRLELERSIIAELSHANGRIFGVAAGTIYSIDAATGEILWQESRRTNLSDPLAVANRLYLGTDNGYFYALDAETGEILWEYRGEARRWAWTNPVLHGETLIVGNLTRGLLALDAETGELLWELSVDPSFLFGSPYLANDVLYFGTGIFNETGDSSVFYAIEPQSGEILWQYEPEMPVLNRPVVDEAGRIYLASVAGGLEILQLP